MSYANIIGWGKCLPPATLTNNDLATFLETNDEWITTRTGIKERRISHVPLNELARVASERALACAGVSAEEIDLIVFGSTTFSEMAPNSASFVQKAIGAQNAACMDLNTACTSFMYSLTTATSLIKTGVAKKALVIGGEVISQLMDWENRNVSVLFGDGCAAYVLEQSDTESGVIDEELACIGEHREILQVDGYGTQYANKGVQFGTTFWNFDGQDIFKRAVAGMKKTSETLLERKSIDVSEIDWLIPHQANLRIIEAVAKKLKISQEKAFINVHRYGNMSAATTPIALIEAIEEGFIKPGQLILQPAFGAGLTVSSHLIRWGSRVTPINSCDTELPECKESALEIVNRIRAAK